MLHVQGELFVRAFGGRRGRFNIGKLVTAYGEFSVRDVLIDELDEGAYPGTFTVERFVLANSQMPSGAVIVEMRARLAAMHLETERPTTAVLEPVGIEERDPIDEVAEASPAPDPETPPAASVDPEHSAVPTATDLPDGSAAAASDDQACDEAGLFAELWPLGDEVQLDPAIGRPVMRRQIEALKRRGYRYNAQRKVTSVEAVSLAIDQMAAVLDWVRPAVLIAVFAGWPWVLAFLLRRRWIDDEECRLLLVHWDELAALMVFLELAFGQNLPLTGFLFYAVWRIYRRFRPSRRLC